VLKLAVADGAQTHARAHKQKTQTDRQTDRGTEAVGGGTWTVERCRVVPSVCGSRRASIHREKWSIRRNSHRDSIAYTTSDRPSSLAASNRIKDRLNPSLSSSRRRK